MSTEENEKKLDIEEQKTPINNPEEKTEEEEKEVTLTPSMLDSEGDEEVQVKRDLSAIIPQGITQPAMSSTELLQLNSKDKDLKTDGVVVLATIKDEENIDIVTDVVLPEQIDVAKRKEEIQKNKNKKQHKKEPKKRLKTKEQKLQNKVSLASLIVIAFLVAAGLFIYKRPTEMGFKALPIEVELGDKLPSSVSTYVKPGIGTTVNEMAYKVDTSKVEIDKIGEYQYTLTYKNKTKVGIVKIVDKTPPSLTLRQTVTITEGQTYTPETFVYECVDYSGCNYSFEDSNTTKKIYKPGKYVVHVIATDAYKNKEMKQANLIIEAVGLVKYYLKTAPFDASKGYSTEYRYELHFTEFGTSAIILNGTYKEIYTYKDDAKYSEARKLYNGELNYTIDDENKVITYEIPANTVGYNYSDINLVHDFLINDGYSEA